MVEAPWRCQPVRSMLSFTLDTNCIIDVAVNRPSASDVMRLVDAHRAGTADVAVVAVSASERQSGDEYLRSYDEFETRLKDLGLSHLRILLPVLYCDIGFWDRGLWADAAMKRREQEIHAVLFPTIEFAWQDFARAAGIEALSIKSREARRWRNAFCDRQMYWAHDHNDRDLFVTSDSNFRRLSGARNFPKARIMSPAEAAALL
jgi:hypothetical protein